MRGGGFDDTRVKALEAGRRPGPDRPGPHRYIFCVSLAAISKISSGA